MKAWVNRSRRSAGTRRTADARSTAAAQNASNWYRNHRCSRSTPGAIGARQRAALACLYCDISSLDYARRSRISRCPRRRFAGAAYDRGIDDLLAVQADAPADQLPPFSWSLKPAPASLPEVVLLPHPQDRCPAARAYAARVRSFAIRPAKSSTNFPTAVGPASTITRGNASAAEPAGTTRATSTSLVRRPRPGRGDRRRAGDRRYAS